MGYNSGHEDGQPVAVQWVGDLMLDCRVTVTAAQGELVLELGKSTDKFQARFDLASGDPAQMPTTGGLDPDGVYHPTWSPAGRDPKADPPGKKAEARRLTRVRRFRYYPVRLRDGAIEVALPHD